MNSINKLRLFYISILSALTIYHINTVSGISQNFSNYADNSLLIYLKTSEESYLLGCQNGKSNKNCKKKAKLYKQQLINVIRSVQ